jgi:hypothetical protein
VKFTEVAKLAPSLLQKTSRGPTESAQLIDNNNNNKNIFRIYKVSLNGNLEASFQYFDPTLEVCQGDTPR